ncbi:hypothetical protein OG799_35285 [Micromonospora sp. NBC_00898]|uniref:hypothetical protein n=1 Tax=Micromonospora sp. NBC_00898 TaxID=2975981 RepID=UPI003863C30B|nr:hypothetical protein OG799_35285 [Micromonospora sp. NBC_00898]
MTTTGAPAAYVWRRPRLARGWEPVQLIGRMKILAARDGIELPKTYQLIRDIYLWEHHRADLPAPVASLLGRIFDHPNPFGTGPITHLPMKAVRTRGR